MENRIPAGWRAPYARSWIDALTEGIARQPFPEAGSYLVISVAAAIVLTVAGWLGHTYPVGSLRPIPLVLAFAIGVFPWLIRRFNVAAGRAFLALDPLLTVDASQRAMLSYRLTNLPFTPTLALGVLIAVLSLARLATSPTLRSALDVSDEPVAYAMSLVVLIAFTFVGSTVPLKFAYQAWMIHLVTTRHIRVGLFEIARLYAFASMTGAMAIVLVITGLVFYLAYPVPLSLLEPFGFTDLVFGITLAAAVFALPLAGVHGRLVIEKERLREEVRASIKIATTELHRVVEAREMASMDPLNKAIASLDIEYRSINDAPTWPWRPDTFRWVVGVLMIPLALFILQQLLPRILP